MKSLILCRDGVIRQRYGYKDDDGFHRYDLPVRAIDDAIGTSSVLSSLHSPVVIEDGLTVRELFRNLTPWGKEVASLATMDFYPFALEAEGKCSDPDQWAKHSHIEVYGSIEIDAVPSYERITRVPGSNDIRELLGMGKAIITNRFDTHVTWQNVSRLYEPYTDDMGITVDGYTVDHSPISDFAHLPIRIKPTIGICDFMVSRDDHLSQPIPLLNPNHPKIETMKLLDGSVGAYKVDIEYEPSFFEAIILGCLFNWSFHYSPVQRDEMTAQLSKQVDRISKNKAAGGAFDDVDEEDLDEGISEWEHRAAADKKLIEHVRSVDPDVRQVHLDPDEDSDV